MNNDKLEEMYNRIVQSSMQEGRLMEQIKILKIVSALHQQGRISDEVMQVFFMELSLDID
jgi:(2Fe-2S) ferredoxin